MGFYLECSLIFNNTLLLDDSQKFLLIKYVREYEICNLYFSTLKRLIRINLNLKLFFWFLLPFRLLVSRQTFVGSKHMREFIKTICSHNILSSVFLHISLKILRDWKHPGKQPARTLCSGCGIYGLLWANLWQTF